MWENHSSPQAAEYTMRDKYNNGKTQRQRPLSPLLRRTAVTMRQRPLSLSLSLSLSLYTVTLYTHTTTKSVQRPTNCFCPKSYLYTYDFRAIYIDGPQRGSQEHINMCPFQLVEGHHHRFFLTSHPEGPISQQNRIMSEFHESDWAGHRGTWATFVKIKQKYWWKNMYEDIT